MQGVRKEKALIWMVLSAAAMCPCGRGAVMDEATLRRLRIEGNSSLQYIMGMVMLGLPSPLVTRIQTALLQARPTQVGFQPRQASIDPQTEPGSPSDSINTEVSGVGKVDSGDPILLNRTKRSFSNPFFFGGFHNSGFFDTNSNIHSPSFHPGNFGGSGHRNTGYNPSGYDRPGHGSTGGNNNHYGGGHSNSFPDHPGSTFGGSSGYGNGYNQHTNNFHYGSTLVCPSQVDQGAVYQYSSDPTFYPAVDIANELFIRSLPGSDLLFQSLIRQVVFPSDPPEVILDPFLLFANTTCRFEEEQVWSYESATFTGRCWPLVNFQEIPYFKTCTNRLCKCDAKDSHYHPMNANLCITEYETLTLWSYCESLLPNRRIVSDRIIVPDACTCTTVECSREDHYGK